MDAIDSINSVYFEGGEPFLFYPILLQGLKLAAQRGLQPGGGN
jgi:pyruvate-formate lyase-activating enzyme